jgi:hypothetical protein
LIFGLIFKLLQLWVFVFILHKGKRKNREVGRRAKASNLLRINTNSVTSCLSCTGRCSAFILSHQNRKITSVYLEIARQESIINSKMLSYSCIIHTAQKPISYPPPAFLSHPRSTRRSSEALLFVFFRHRAQHKNTPRGPIVQKNHRRWSTSVSRTQKLDVTPEG